VLTPLAVDPAHPFPYISDLSLNLAVVVGAPRSTEQRIARVKVPPLLPRFVVMPDGERFVPVEQVIASHLDRLFPGMRVVGQYPFRVTRNADPALEEEEAEDLRTAVQEYLRRRRRSPQVVRLEIDETMSEEVERLLMRELELSAEDVYTVAGPLDLNGLWGLYEINRPDLKERLPAPVIPPALAKPPGDEAEVDIFRVIDSGDVLVHHPYESFASSVEAFIDQAVSDPDVLAIKQTLYRTSGPDSPIVRSLITAAERGKQVGRAGRADRALRRGGEHHLGRRAREGRRARRVRGRRPQDPRQGNPGGAPHQRRDPALLPHGHRQLQLTDRPPLRGPRPALSGHGARRGPHRSLQLPDRL